MAEGAAVRALRESLRGRGAPVDKAAEQLARRYAGLLDEAALASKYRPLLDRIAAAIPARHTEALAALERVRDALGAHSVASDLGPKYLAVLAQLGLTPAARGAKAAPPVEPVPDPEPVPEAAPAPEGKADELRKRRAERAERLAAGSG